MSKTCECKHCGSPSSSVICPSCFLRYDHRASGEMPEEEVDALLAAAFEPAHQNSANSENAEAFSFQRDSKIMASAETMLSWFARMPRMQ